MKFKYLLSFVLVFTFQHLYPQGIEYDARAIYETRHEFFMSKEAERIGDQLLLWQRNTGGWPKNKDMVAPISETQRAEILNDKQRMDDSTTDNHATTLQMMFLARLYKTTCKSKYKESFTRGVQYLLSGQYANGGWPQFWPVNRGYQIHITYNDDAMVNTLTLLLDILEGKEPFDSDICESSVASKIQSAFDKGIDCILATQIRLSQRTLMPISPFSDEPHTLTIWCQQHDRETLMPAAARSYELPSYCTQESAGIVRLLMRITNPDSKIKNAINCAMQWFEHNKLTGIRVEHYINEKGQRDTRLTSDSTASPIWARFYDLKTCKPFVCDRDGIPQDHLEDIGYERRNGYSWYGQRPAEISKLYETWKNKYSN